RALYTLDSRLRGNGEVGAWEWREFCSRRLFLGCKQCQFSSPRLRNGLWEAGAHWRRDAGNLA
ncbi:MAG: hypothetical protein OXU61_04065, partial [Gammaproteobacteria bacterium]|nr:hypothetical protein [Gammaproteobacteria bacterium]